MIYILLLLLFQVALAKEQYIFEGKFKNISIAQYDQLLLIKNSDSLYLTEQPPSAKYSHLLDTSIHDAMFQIKKDVRVRAQKNNQQLVITFYKEGELRPIVLLDAGHGGNDPGAISSGGLKEKDVTLNFAELLYNHLNKELGEGIVKLRTSDQTITKYERLEKVIQSKPYYLISIHADSYTTPNARGMGVLCLDDSHGSERSRAILLKHQLTQSPDINSAKGLGDYILSKLDKSYHLHASKTTASPLVILRSPLTTSILIELGFLSHPIESKNLANPQYIEKLSHDIALVILDYLTFKEGIIPIKRL